MERWQQQVRDGSVANVSVKQAGEGGGLNLGGSQGWQKTGW